MAGRVAKNYKTYLKPDWPEVVQEFSTKEIMGHSADRLCEVFGKMVDMYDQKHTFA